MRTPLAMVYLVLAIVACPSVAEEHLVAVGVGFTFVPAFLEILEGDTVHFFNIGGTHNVRADDDSFRCAQGCDGDGKGGNGSPSSVAWDVLLAFDTAGDVPYYCELHGDVGGIGMSGLISVGPATIFADGFESGGTGAWGSRQPVW